MTQENSLEKKNKFLVGAVIVLALGLAFQTGVLLTRQTNPKPEAKEKYAAPSGQSLPAVSRKAHYSPYDASWDMDRWDPFAEMDRMQDQMNRMFNESFRHASALMDPGTAGTGISRSFFEPDIDLQDKKDHYLITIDIPGMEKDQIDVTVREHMLTVSGNRKSESEKKDEKQGFYSMERRFGSFTRSIPLPDDADPETVKANYEKGVLKIEIQKLAQEITAPEARKVSVQ